MIYNMKNVSRITAIICASAWLSSCSTLIQVLHYIGQVKILANLQQIKGLGLTLKRFVRIKISHFLFMVLLNLFTIHMTVRWDEAIMLTVQPFIRKQNINLQVNIDGIMYLLTLKAKLLLTVLTQALVILIKSLTAKIWTKYSMIKLK